MQLHFQSTLSARFLFEATRPIRVSHSPTHSWKVILATSKASALAAHVVLSEGANI